jgi:hypothetical protein
MPPQEENPMAELCQSSASLRSPASSVKQHSDTLWHAGWVFVTAGILAEVLTRLFSFYCIWRASSNVNAFAPSKDPAELTGALGVWMSRAFDASMFGTIAAMLFLPLGICLLIVAACIRRRQTE